MATIILDKDIYAQEPILTNEVSYETIIDNSALKVVATEVTLKSYPLITKSLILWEGAEYDKIGQWTDEQAEQRIKELLESE
jgi:hypothetical protein